MMERKKANTLEELLKDCPQNLAILKMFTKTWTVVNDPLYERIACKISGGSDSDVMLDVIWRCDKESKVTYVWFDAGLEYQATKDHLVYLEAQYGIQIQRERAVLPIPLSVKNMEHRLSISAFPIIWNACSGTVFSGKMSRMSSW